MLDTPYSKMAAASGDLGPHVKLVFAFAAFAVVVSDPFATIFRFTGPLFFGNFLFTGEPCFQKNTDGTAVGFKLFLRPVTDVR